MAEEYQPPYVYQPYPRMLYRDGDAPCIVEDAEAEAVALTAGWRKTPDAVEEVSDAVDPPAAKKRGRPRKAAG